MGRVLTLFGSLRLPMLLFALPYAMLWMRASESGGWLMVMTHAALVLFGFAGVDASVLRRGGEPRLALRRNIDWFDLRTIEIARAILGIVALALGFALLFVQWKIGATALLALVLMEIWSDGSAERVRRSRFAWAEWILPLVVLIGPATLVQISAESRKDRLEIMLDNAIRDDAELRVSAVNSEEATRAADRVAELTHRLAETQLLSHGVFWATIIGALALSVYVLLCLRRDEPLDRGEGLRTTATRLGRASTSFDVIVMLGALVLLAAYGAHHAWWGPWPAVIAAWGAVLTAWASASRRDDTAVGAWFIAHLALAVSFSLTVA